MKTKQLLSVSGFLLMVAFLLASSISIAQTVQKKDMKEFKDYWYDSKTGMIKLVKPADQVLFTENNAWLKKTLNFDSETGLKLIGMTSDDLGFSHYRYRQTYKNIPIEGSMYIVHVKGGFILSANGEYLPQPQVNPSPSLDESTALDKALEDIAADVYIWEVRGEENLLKLETKDSSATYFPTGELTIVRDSSNEAKLAYRFDIYAKTPLSRNYVYVDASSGEIIRKIPRIHLADVTGSGTTRYSGVQTVTMDDTGTEFRLRETGRGNGIETYNMQNTEDYGNAIDFTHPDNLWDTLPLNDDLALDAHFGAEMTYDYYLNVHGRNSIDNNGFTLKSYIHYGNDFGNAFWDGQRMTYGDGDQQVGPLVTLDICAHEITHGLTEHTAGLGQGEAGALNESFSDIIGVLVEHHTFPTHPNSDIYVTGEQVIQGGMRSMIDPDATSSPDTYGGNNWDNQGQNVHNNGVVQGHWFYILAEGKSGTNDNGDSYAVTGIGKDKAGDIAFRNLTTYLTPNSNFNDARLFSIQAAEDLFGGCSNEVIATTDAWYAVGVGDEYNDSLVANFTSSLVLCSNPTQITFNNSSTGAASYSWDFGDGNTSTLSNPTHTYTADGSYTVSLSAIGCSGGSDSITASEPIIVDNSVVCDTAQLAASGNTLSENCHGLLFDSGGKDGAPLQNANGSVTISPTNAQTITLTFSSFEYGGFTDNVRVFDGPNTSSPILGTFNLFTVPTVPLVSTGPSITIQETTGTLFPGQPESPGFEAAWECTPIPAGIEDELDASSWSIYPNPSMGIFNVELNNLANQFVEMTLLDVVGRPVKTTSVMATNNTVLEFDVQDKPNGVYYLFVRVDHEPRGTQRVVLTH